ncbi:potassium voltage-gated channel subfamily H member 2 isoform X2 [Planococcus citri]|uniref:potassium voltage-gated channel subfamily H member 2 isoform X2 n=1 Tax=Planococcus citri TaxID=170843 RepID=UPI0031F88EE5
MPVRRGHVAPRTTLIETIIRKFDTHDRSFVVANAQHNSCHVIYCSDGFCRLTGYSRAEVMQRSAVCDFLHGPLTSQSAVQVVKQALAAGVEKHFEILYYRKDGTKFRCSEVIAPVKSEADDISLYIINFEDLSAPSSPVEDLQQNLPLSKFDRARQSFRQSLRMGSLRRNRGLRNSSQLTPVPGADEDEESSHHHQPVTASKSNESKETGVSISVEEERLQQKTPPIKTQMNHVSHNPPNSEVFPVNLEEGVPDPQLQATKSLEESYQRALQNSRIQESLDMYDRWKRAGSMAVPCTHHHKGPVRSATLPTELQEEEISPPKRPHTIDNCSSEARNHFSKRLPTTSSESDLQKYRSSSSWDRVPSLSNIANSDSLKYKYSIQDNGSAKFFQGALHTPNMGEKVAQVLSLGADILPEYTLQSPRIHKWTILHYSPFKAVWDWIILLLVMYTAIFTPYVAAFLLHEKNYAGKLRQYSNDPMWIIELIVDVTFVVDILINFRTTYVNRNDEVVSHPGKIAFHYLRGWFLIDLVAAIPFDIFVMGKSTNNTSGSGDEVNMEKEETTTLIGLLKTARLLRLVRVARKIDRYSEYGAAVLLLLMATFALIAHWLACIWYAIALTERPHLVNKVGWLDILANDTQQYYNTNDTEGNNSGPTIKSKYITALYFTFSCLTSVGFGNVAANTDSEKVFTICVMLVGSLMYASIFGNVSAIIQRLYSGTARYHTQMLRVREFIRFHQIPNPLRQRLEEYFQHAWTYTNGIDMNSVLKAFPECLQADICLHLNRNLLKNCSAFNGASPGCLRALSLKFKTTHAPPGDTLVHRGDVLISLYFISRGSIEILKDDVVMAILGKNDIFGENPCKHLTLGKSSCNVRALTYCDLHKIHRDDLLDVLEMYPEFYHSFSENLEITFYMRDDEQAGVDPRKRKFLARVRSRSSSHEGAAGAEEGGGNIDLDISNSQSHRFQRERNSLDSGPDFHPQQDEQNTNNDSNCDKCSGYGILEFNTDKAGQDVTPMNFQFAETSQSRSAINSITGVFNQLKRSLTDIRSHTIGSKSSTKEDDSFSQTGYPTATELRIKRSSSSQNFKYYLNSPPDLLSESEPLLENQMLASDSSEPTPRHEKRDPSSSSIIRQNVYQSQANLQSPIHSLSPAGSNGNVVAQPSTSTAQYVSPVSLSPLHSNNNLFQSFPDGKSPGSVTVINAANAGCSFCGVSRTDLDLHNRIDQVSRQLENLERSVSNDVRLILALLTQQNTQIIPDINLPPNEPNFKLPRSPITRSYSNSSHENLRKPKPCFRSSSQDESKSSTRLQDTRTSVESSSSVPKRSLSQPVNLSQFQLRSGQDFMKNISSTSAEVGDLFDSENWPAELPAVKKRQQFAEKASVTSEETTVGECVPLAPLARLDSLQEMDTFGGDNAETPTSRSPL